MQILKEIQLIRNNKMIKTQYYCALALYDIFFYILGKRIYKRGPGCMCAESAVVKADRKGEKAKAEWYWKYET